MCEERHKNPGEASDSAFGNHGRLLRVGDIKPSGRDYSRSKGPGPGLALPVPSEERVLNTSLKCLSHGSNTNFTHI